jgi:hypothetical protein
MGLWSWLRGIGGNPDEEADLQEEFGREDPGEAEERYLSETGYGAGAGFGGGSMAIGEAAEAAEADLEDTKPPPDPAP